MKVLSVNVGQPRLVPYRGNKVSTCIFKGPVEGPVAVHELGLEGDKQSDLRVHGGLYKAVYAYPREHYAYWQEIYPDIEMPVGMFGENLTVEGLLEKEVNVGDKFQIGSAELVATQPREPCFKLGIKFGRFDVIKKFARSGRSGFYFAVAKTGTVSAGDKITLLERADVGISIAQLVKERYDL